jgi:hypothetical protein
MVIDTENVVYASYPTNEWIVDFETGQNKPPKSSIDAVSQDLKFALSVERYKFPIMGSNYGITLDDLVGTDFNYIRSEAERRIRDALSIDDRVLAIEKFNFETKGADSLIISFVVKTTFGDVPLETEISA